MLPIYIICHADCNPSSYLCSYFDKHKIAYQKINALHNDVNSLDLNSLSGLVFMGGPYSVYDNHPWQKNELRLILRAIDKNIPIMGVCFGSQLISKVLGARVFKADHMELGWHMIIGDTSKLDPLQPLNLDKNFEVFEWHEDVFSLPEGATSIFSSNHHENQGYVWGNILVMQFHLEMTEHMIKAWLEQYQSCLPKASQSVQSPEYIMQALDERLHKLHTQADKIYHWWLQSVNTKYDE
ncbi:MAG: gamma-glutamyl-gamma-aminobutyrate hydrolase family protein [Thiotrichaceae bacterium]|nr:gamma-glutamyl-gamma-aminobutyrate hydrolase family protein [Thiotrichaceae bacterium]